MDLGSAHGRIEFLYDGGGVQRAVSDLQNLQNTGNNIGQTMGRVGGVMLGVGGAISGAVGIATGVAANFEQQLSNIASVGGKEAVDRMDELRDVALQLGTDTAFSAGEAATGMEQLIKAGLPLDDVLNGAAAAALDMAAATGTPVLESATLMATALNVFGEGMTEYTTQGEKAVYIADLFSQVSNATATDARQLGMAFRQTATVADLFGLSVDDTAMALGIMADKGLEGSDAGTSFKQMLLSLTNASGPTVEALGELGLSTNSFYDEMGNFVGVPAMFDTLRTAMEGAGYTSEQVNDTLAQIFGSDAIRAASIFFDTNEAGWDEMGVKMEEAGTAAEQAEIRMDNFKGVMEQLTGSIETALVAFGTPLLEGMRNTAEGIKEIVDAFIGLDPAIQGAISKTIALTGTILGVGGSALIAASYFVSMAQALGMTQAAALRLVAVFGVLGFLAAAVGIAYATNWLGLGDKIREITGNAVTALEGFAEIFDNVFSREQAQGANKLSAAITAFGRAVTRAFGWDIEDKTEALAAGIQAVDDAFWNATNAGANFLSAALMGLSEGAAYLGLTDISDGLASLSLKAQAFGEEFARVQAGLAEQEYADISDEILAFGEALRIVTGIDVTGATRRIADFANTVSFAFDQAISQGASPFEAAMRAVQAGIEDITGLDLSGITDGIGNIGGTIRDIGSAIREADFDGVGAILSSAVDSFRAFAEENIPQVLSSIGDAIGSVDLGDIAVNVGNWIQGQWEDLKSWLETTVKPLIPEINIGEIAATIGGWVITSAGNIADAIRAFINGGYAGEGGPRDAGPSESIDLGEIRAQITSWLIEQGSDLVTAVTDKINQLKEAIPEIPLDEIKATITGWVIEIGQGADTLLSKIQEHADAAVSGASDFIAKIPSIAADIGSWAITAAQDISTAIQSFLGGGGELSGSGHLTGSGALSVDLGSVAANIGQWLAGAGATAADFISDIKDTLGEITIPIDAITATISTITIDAAGAIQVAVSNLQSDIQAAMDGVGGANTMGGPGERGEAFTVPPIEIEEIEPPRTDPLKKLEDWINDINSRLQTIGQIDALDFGIAMFDLGNEIGNSTSFVAEKIAEAAYAVEGATKDMKGFNKFMTFVATGVGAAAVAIAAVTAGFVSAMAGLEDFDAESFRKKLDEVGGIFDQLEGIFSGELLSKQSGGELSGSGDFTGPGTLLDDTTTIGFWATEIERIITDMENNLNNLIVGVQGVIDGFKAKWNDMWNIFTQSTAEDYTSAISEGEGVGAGISPMSQFVDGIVRGIESIPQELEARVPDLPDNPFEPIGNWLNEKIEGFFGLLSEDAEASDGEGIDGSEIGRTFGEQITDAFSSEEFIAGMEAGIQDIPANTFQGIGEELMSQVTDGITLALASGTVGAPGESETGMATSAVGSDMAAGLIKTLISNVTLALETIDIPQFADLGKSLLSKIQQGIAGALTLEEAPAGLSESTQAGQGGAGFASSLITSLVSSISSGITAAPIEQFAALKTAFQSKLSQVLATLGQADSMGGPGERGEAGTQVGAQFIQGLIQDLTSAAQSADFSGVGQTIGDAFNQGLTAGFQSAAQTATTFMTQIAASITALAGNFQTAGQTVGNAYNTGFIAGMQAAAASATSFGGQIAAILQSFTGQAQAAGQAVGAAFDSGLLAGLQAAAATASSFAVQIAAILATAADSAYASGQAVGQGFADGIASMVGQVSAAAGQLAGAAIGGIAGAIVEGSPSKVTTEQGVNTGLGFVEGLRQLISDALAEGTELGQAGVQGLIDGIKSLHEQLYNEITSMANTVEGGMEEANAALGSTTDEMAAQAGQTGEKIGTATTDSMEKAISADGGTEIVKDAGTTTGEELGTGVTEGMEKATSGLCDTMATQATDAAGCATDAIKSAAGEVTDTATSTLGTEAGAATGEEFGNSFGQEMASAMLGQMELGGDGIGGQAMNSILSQIGHSTQDVAEGGRKVGQELGTAIETGMTENLNFDPQAMGIPKAGQDLATQLFNSMQQRLESYRADAKELMAERNQYAAQLMERGRPIHIEVVSQLDGKELDRRTVETVFGAVDESLSRNPSNRRQI